LNRFLRESSDGSKTPCRADQTSVHDSFRKARQKDDGQEISACKMCEHYFAKESQEDKEEDERKEEKKIENI
jgi:hypothetical protein